MSYTTATYSDVTAFDGRLFPLGADLRALRGIVIVLATVAAAGAMLATVTLGAGWMIGAALSTNPGFHARGAISPEMAAGSYRRLAGTAEFPGSARLLTQIASARDLTMQAELHRAAAAKSASVAAPLPRPVREAVNAVLPRPRPMRAIAAAVKRMQIAALTPPTPAIIPPAGVLPLPAKQPAQPKPHIPLPPPQTVQPAKTEAKHEEAPARPKQSAPLVTGSLPPPQTSPKQLTVQQALTGNISMPGHGSRTAVYDIEAHTVYLPDGRQLEAHSGLGNGLDNPRYADQRRRGPTPPNIYNLALRRAIFHGVQAIRLNPVDEDAMHGRDGMLAHTYMLGPTGRSFGCVSFKHYSAFLHAFLNGEIDRLVVVPRLKSSVRTADAEPRPVNHYAFNAE